MVSRFLSRLNSPALTEGTKPDRTRAAYLLRHARFLGLREDKESEKVTLEGPQAGARDENRKATFRKTYQARSFDLTRN